MPFPSPPWRMNAQMWLSVFRVADTGRADRLPGIYGAAFVSYEEGSALIYRELVIARLLDPLRRAVEITDIWVDSEESLEGGRSLWAIPKQLADVSIEERTLGPAARDSSAAITDGVEIASSRFASVPGAALVRAPYSASAHQRRGNGVVVRTPMRGSARGFPAVASWDFPADGPLSFLHRRRPLLSFRLRDVRLTFG
jgi:hypothetical protein